MMKSVTASLIATLVLSSVAQAQTAAPSAPAEDTTTTVKDVVVVGGKLAPTAENPRTATCEFLVANDPFIRAQIEAAAGDPMMGPRFYQPTRYPRIVKFGAAPLSPPGSALPSIGRQYRGVTTRRVGADGVSATEQRLYDNGLPSRPASSIFDPEDTGIGPTEFTQEAAINSCRSQQQLGGSGSGGVDWASGKYELAYRDKTLPTAFALFEDGRYAESLDYFQRAFKKLSYEMGGDEAALMIGKLLLGAPGVERDTPKAMVWLERAGGARFNGVTDTPIFDPREPGRNTAIGEAAMILGRIYQLGYDTVAKDPAKSRKWFERAFKVGHVPAAAILGDIYYYGSDTPRDLAKAFDNYKKAATLGYAPAQASLGEMYLSGEAPGGRNQKLGLAWHNEAAKLGQKNSLYTLALAYENGDGVPADPQRALGLYKLAALSGSAPARNIVGTYFYQGHMLPKDPAMARRWFTQAAADGDADAMYNLGGMMMKGEGGSVDRVHAWAWFKLAERSENPQAAAAVRALEPQMTADEKAQAAKLVGPTNS